MQVNIEKACDHKLFWMGVRIKASVFVHFISLQVVLFHLINKVIAILCEAIH